MYPTNLIKTARGVIIRDLHQYDTVHRGFHGQSYAFDVFLNGEWWHCKSPIGTHTIIPNKGTRTCKTFSVPIGWFELHMIYNSLELASMKRAA